MPRVVAWSLSAITLLSGNWQRASQPFRLLDGRRLSKAEGLVAFIVAAAKVIVLVAIITAVNMAWLFAGAALTRLFREPRTNRAINVTFTVLLVASVAFALLF